VLARELRVVRLNAHFAAFLGGEISEATGLSVSRGGGELGARAQRLAAQALRGGHVGDQVLSEDGQRRWRMSAGASSRAGAIDGVVLVVEDITDQQRLASLASNDPLTGRRPEAAQA
jgi:PAS domain-containing protein